MGVVYDGWALKQKGSYNGRGEGRTLPRSSTSRPAGRNAARKRKPAAPVPLAPLRAGGVTEKGKNNPKRGGPCGQTEGRGATPLQRREKERDGLKPPLCGACWLV